ncbi:MAG: DUF3095 family protein [Proteobacteria bacterium]|nr:DUF3095 family protein [Pseudomonadota bacterium]
MNSLNFYENLNPLKELNEALEGKGFSEAPIDWHVVLCDVKGSTLAIEKGQYKNVNFAGASAITAILNKIDHQKIPYVFGGDGATILVPSENLESIISALISTQKFVQDTFDLKLRVTIFPYKNLVESGKRINVAKLRKGENCYQALLMGEGLLEVEKTAKSHSELFLNLSSIKCDLEMAQDNPAPLEGLSCRWQPLFTQRGQILSIIALSQNSNDTQNTLASLFETIRKIVPNLSTRSPVDQESLKYTLIPQGWKLEWKRDAFHFPKWLFLISIFFKVGFLKIVFALRPNMLLGFPVEKYFQEMLKQNDFIKLEESLKMIIDCSADESEKIEQLLNQLYSEGKIFYGLHRANSATMTCLVFKAENGEHIHFLDGSNGGYTSAAKKLKEQIKMNLPKSHKES